MNQRFASDRFRVGIFQQLVRPLGVEWTRSLCRLRRPQPAVDIGPSHSCRPPTPGTGQERAVTAGGFRTFRRAEVEPRMHTAFRSTDRSTLEAAVRAICWRWDRELN